MTDERAMLRTAAVALVALLSAASLAAAQDPPAAPDGPRAGCTPRLGVVVHGRFLAGGTTSFQMNVRRSSRPAWALRGPRELLVDSRTRFRRQGRPATLGTLRPGDRLQVFLRACRNGSAARLELAARSVLAV
jgi:hypothetical protein